MSIQRIKGYSVFCLSFVLLTLLLLILAGCDATSDPRQYYQLTGSWQGTIGDDRVRGIIAPDGSYHLAIVDESYNFFPENDPRGGEYTGKASIVDKDNNIGRMTVALLHPFSNADVGILAFKLNAATLYSEDNVYPVMLTRTNEADVPLDRSASQADVEGHWSLTLSATDKYTAAIVDADGNLSGKDDEDDIDAACQYSGTLKLLDPAWNIFQLDLTFKNLPGKNCLADTVPYSYRGLVMALSPQGGRRQLWIASNSWELSSGNRTGTYFGLWAETLNVAPVARMTANTLDLGESVVLLKMKNGGTVKLGAQKSSDENKDALTYRWSGTAPDGASIFQDATAEGVEVTFTPTTSGIYTLQLTANDGLLDSAVIERQIEVEWVVDRFVDCQNGTVLDTTNNRFWLKDAGCRELHDPAPDKWWVNLVVAKGNVALLADPSCNLTDDSVASNWRLPSLSEFGEIIDTDVNHAAWDAPALVNGEGSNQWSEGDIFESVGINPFAPAGIWRYWTSEPVFALNGIQYGYYVNFDYRANPPLSDYTPISDTWAVWPVRDEISAGAGDEINACLQKAPQP